MEAIKQYVLKALIEEKLWMEYQKNSTAFFTPEWDHLSLDLDATMCVLAQVSGLDYNCHHSNVNYQLG